MAVIIAGLNEQTGYVITEKYLNGTEIYRSRAGLVYLKSSKHEMTTEKSSLISLTFLKIPLLC